jgi:hypothetical protein
MTDPDLTYLAEQLIGGPLPQASDNLKMALAKITTDAEYRDRYHPDFGWEWQAREPEQSASIIRLLTDVELVRLSAVQRKHQREMVG